MYTKPLIICLMSLLWSHKLWCQDISQAVEVQDTITEKPLKDSLAYNQEFTGLVFNEDKTVNFQNPTGNTKVPLSKLFYKMGGNALHSVTYNYGANYAVAALGTYGLVKSGIDWKWNRMAYNNAGLAWSGTPFGVLGYIVPVAAPVGLYVYGRKHDDVKLQITGLALGQSAILALGISSTIKAFTGRREPGIMEHHIYPDRTGDTSDYSGDWAFGFMERGIFSGWPSSHTIVAFALATTLTELYPDNTWLKIGAFAYAGCTGLGMSLFGHWASESFAGALMGYAIGKSVGRSFNGLLGNKTNADYLLYATPNGVGLTINF